MQMRHPDKGHIPAILAEERKIIQALMLQQLMLNGLTTDRKRPSMKHRLHSLKPVLRHSTTAEQSPHIEMQVLVTPCYQTGQDSMFSWPYATSEVTNRGLSRRSCESCT